MKKTINGLSGKNVGLVAMKASVPGKDTGKNKKARNVCKPSFLSRYLVPGAGIEPARAFRPDGF